jgi:PhzF family phenazine biosynthesis protein
MKYDIHILNSFVRNGYGGNPAGVVILDDEIPSNQRQAIAKQVGLSETAFVKLIGKQAISLRFHTPNREILNCGHATLAALRLMRDKNLIEDGEVSFYTSEFSGRANIRGKHISMSQEAPTFEEFEDRDTLLDSLGLDESALAGVPEIVSTGNRFLVIPVKDEAVLENLRPDFEKVQALSLKFNLIGYYPFMASLIKSNCAYARMFAPAYGIPEESATGMAAGTLAGYLDKHGHSKETEYEIYQGQFMSPSSPSRLFVKLSKEVPQIMDVSVGGEVRYSSTRSVEIEPSHP